MRRRSGRSRGLSPMALGLILALLLGAVSGPTLVPKKLSKSELEALAKDVGFPDPVYAATIAMRESGGNPYAVNDNPPRERSYGLWQINVLAWKKYDPKDLIDPRKNAEAAYDIWKQAGWAPWATAKERRGQGPGSQ